VQAQRGAASPCAGGPCNAIERLADTGNDSRIALWRNVLELIALRPWTGWGWGELDYAHYVTLFGSPRFSDKLDNAHNLPLQLAVELGLPAAGLICIALWVLLWRARPWRESQPWRQAAWLVLAVIGLHSLLEYPLWYGPFQIATVLCACGLYWHGRSGRPADGPTPQQPASEPAHSAYRQRAWDALAAALLLAAAVVAFDYHRVSQIYLPAAQRHSAYRMQALAHAQASWFFQGHARFAQLALTPLSADNAAEQLRLAQWLLHHSPEPLVIERLLDAAALLGDERTQAFHAARYQAAYPGDHARWLRRQSAGRVAASP
jgi:hypothetical protein